MALAQWAALHHHTGWGAVLPDFGHPTGQVTVGKAEAEAGEYRGVMMPKHKRTRAERAINEARIAEEQRQYEAWLAATYERPPF